jgi:NADP-dependent 3-hydroxy acid dehydrogenase YdfG
MSALTDQVVCITGAGRGLGSALARAFDAAGARLVLASRTAGEIDELCGACRDAIAVQTDVRVPDEVRALIDAAVGEFGRLDVMINNAGVAVYGPVNSYTPTEIDNILDTNVKGTIYGCQAAFAVMKAQRSGFIVNIGSITGTMHLANESVYGASKWAVRGYSGVLWQEARQSGVRVCHVAPGGIDTPFWKTQEFLPFPDKYDPERDFLKPDELAQTVVELVSTSSGYCPSEIIVQPVLF